MTPLVHSGVERAAATTSSESAAMTVQLPTRPRAVGSDLATLSERATDDGLLLRRPGYYRGADGRCRRSLCGCVDRFLTCSGTPGRSC